MRTMTMRAVVALAAVAAPSITTGSQAMSPPPGSDFKAIDKVVTGSMAAFKVPGVAVGIVKDGKIVFAKGYGVREVGKAGAVDPDTLFAIASNTKPFTSAALAILVDEGKIKWDDRVVDYIPDFRLPDPWVTREFTIRDLLAHRSGFGPAAGDLMFAGNTDFTRTEVIRSLRHLPVETSFRSKFEYQNNMFMVAGEIIPAVTGQSWEAFVEERIMARLGMKSCASQASTVAGVVNRASPHVVVGAAIKPVVPDAIDAAGAAGSAQCNLSGMTKWVAMQLAHGKTSDGSQLISAAQQQEMWAPQTIMSVDPSAYELSRTHFAAYGLGWFLADLDGYKNVNHTGGVNGMASYVSMIPELNLGVVILVNQRSGEALFAIMNQILKTYTGAKQRDWVARFKVDAEQREATIRAAVAEAKADPVTEDSSAVNMPLAAYVGTYRDKWRGDATIRQQGDKLILKFSHTNDMEGPLTPVRPGIFAVHWNNRDIEADALVRFSPDFDGNIEVMTMRPISPLIDFSFDYKDLNFLKIAAE